MNKLNKKDNFFRSAVHVIFAIAALSCIVPMILLVIISFSSKNSVVEVGYSFFPTSLSTEAYDYLFKHPKAIVDSYGVTLLVTVVGTTLSLLFTSMLSFVLSRPDYRYARQMGFIVFFAMLFHAGLIPTYILYTNYYGLKDSIWVLILPGVISTWNVILLRTFFFDTPLEVLEAATIDGGSEFTLYWRIMMPMSTPALATIGLVTALGFWNQWQTSMIYIDTQSKYMLQYLLYKILKQAEILREEAMMGMTTEEFPSDTIKMAMAVIAAGPMMFVFPFFQKYFVRGIASGAVKG